MEDGQELGRKASTWCNNMDGMLVGTGQLIMGYEIGLFDGCIVGCELGF